MIDTVEYHQATFTDPPSKFEAGTLPIAQIIGLQKALEWISSQDLDMIREEEISLAKQTRHVLKEQLPGVEFLTEDPQSTIVTFWHPEIPTFDLIRVLAEEHIALRGGHHCVQPYHHKINQKGTTRISLGAYNSSEDIEKLEQALNTINKIFL